MLPWLFILVTHTRAHTLPDSSSLSHTHTHTHTPWLFILVTHTHTHTHTHTRTHPRRQALFWPLLSRQGSWTLETGFPTQGLGTVQSSPSEPSKTNALLWQFGSGLGEVAWAEFLSFDIRLYWMLCVSHSLKKNVWVFHLIPQGSPVRYVLVLSPFYRWENWSTKCPRSLLRSEEAEIEFFLTEKTMQYNSAICTIIMRFLRDIDPWSFYRRVIWEEGMFSSWW